MLQKKYFSLLMAIAIFLIAFFFIPFWHSNFLSMMPGDIGDARLNHYFLENIFQYFFGQSLSLWNLGFFAPFSYVGGFSDNLFGASPVYLIARLLTGKAELSFQIWYLFGYFVNYMAAYYALNKLGHSRAAAITGALIFAFALPVEAYSGHIQLHYRFAVPLAIAFLLLFLEKKNWHLLLLSVMWLVWQFYCSIYIGVFTFLMLSAILAVYCIDIRFSKTQTLREKINEFSVRWREQSFSIKLKYVLIGLFLFTLMILLFYPYLKVSQLYGAHSSWVEIASMLPRPQSYFISNGSWLWSYTSQFLPSLPMQHEHQMFIGAIPFLLALIGLIGGSKNKNGSTFTLLWGSLTVLMLLSLCIGGYSLWILIAKLPIISAIRAVARIELVFLFPMAYLSGIAVDSARPYCGVFFKPILIIIVIAIILESYASSPPLSSKKDWIQRITNKEHLLPSNLPSHPILFFAQSKGPFYAEELDAMWVALNHGLPTLNGYSGLYPPGFSVEYGNKCSELPRRIMSYLTFIGHQNDPQAYQNLIQSVVPIGFVDCDKKWLLN